MRRRKAHWLSLEYRPWGIPTQRRGIRDYMNMEELGKPFQAVLYIVQSVFVHIVLLEISLHISQ